MPLRSIGNLKKAQNYFALNIKILHYILNNSELFDCVSCNFNTFLPIDDFFMRSRDRQARSGPQFYKISEKRLHLVGC